MQRQMKSGMTAWMLILALTSLSGCTHYHYYGKAMPVCETPVTTIAPQGSVCDVPDSSGTVIATAPSSSFLSGSSICQVPGSSGTVVINPPRSSTTTVIGVPHGRSSRLTWRRPDPENYASTKVDGALQSSQIK